PHERAGACGEPERQGSCRDRGAPQLRPSRGRAFRIHGGHEFRPPDHPPDRGCPMKIAFFGSSLVSSYWNGAATYYRRILRALARNGHQIRFFEPDAFGRQEHRDIPDPDWAEVVIYKATDAGWRAALRQARDADLVVKASGVGVFDRELEAAVLAERRPGQMVLFWDVDAPATLDRIAQDPNDPMRFLIPGYDMILTYGGGPRVVAAYAALGARRCVPIYNAVD